MTRSLRSHLAWLAAVLALAVFSPARGQTLVSPAPSQVFAGSLVTALAVQPDGKVIVGGQFTHAGSTTRVGLARLNADGSVDAAWNPGAVDGNFSTVYSIAVDGAGNVYVGGSFTSIGGVTRNNLARLSGTTGAVDLGWNPNANNDVLTMVLDPAGSHLFLGGGFFAIGGVSQGRLAKVSTTTGAVDATWAPQVAGTVYGLAIEGSSLFVRGQISNVNGSSRWGLAKLSRAAPATLDGTWNPGANGQFLGFALDGAGNLYVAGSFTAVGGQLRNNLAKLSTSGTGAADATWNPGASAPVYDVAVEGSSVYVAGFFAAVGGLGRQGGARISATGSGTVDSVWNPGVVGISAGPLAIGAKVFLAGNYSSVGAQPRISFAAMDKASGMPDLAWPNFMSPGIVNALVRDPAGGTIVAGRFGIMGDGTTPRSNMARFNADGSLDPAYVPNVNGEVMALALDSAGLLYAGGFFTSIGGSTRNRIARMSSGGTGTLDAGWNPGADGGVRALKLDAGGVNLYAGGEFANIGGQARNRIARLSTSTGTADAWNPNASAGVYALAVSGAGDVYAGGLFATIGGQTRNNIAKLSPAGSGAADATWNANASSLVLALAVDGSTLYAGGSFTTIGGQSRSNLARLSLVTGSADLNWNPGPNGSVGSLLPDGTGNLYVGGAFSTLGGQTRQGLAKIASTGTGAASPTWTANTSLFAPGFGIGNGRVSAMALDGEANLYAGGMFTTVVGQARASYAVLSAKTAQTITFNTPAPQVLGNPPVPLVATATSGLPVAFTSLTPAICGISGTSATLLANGVCTIAANQAGDAAYSAAPQVVRSFPIGVPSAPTITSIVAANTQIAISFTPPTSDGGRPITGYTARCTDGTTTRTATGPSSPLVVSGLTNGVTYTCTVTSENDQGEGPASDPGGGTPTTGSGVPPTINVGSLAFAGQSMGTTSRPKELTLTNPGPFTITVASLTLSPQFGQANDCIVLAAGASCTVQVTFSPIVVAGALNSTVPVTGTLVVNTDGGNLSINLSGTAEKSLVSHYYSAILRRDADAGGKAFWSNEAARVAALGANLSETWFALAADFYRSGEYLAQNRNTTEYVRDLYNTFYNRAADDGGLNFWTGQIDSGLPREVVLIAFMFSPEFANFTAGIFGSATVRAELNTVIDFYRGLLARLPDDGGFNFWVNKFRAAQCQGAAAVTAEVEAISSAFATSPEYGARGRDHGQYVTDLYNAFLRRGGDLTGYQFWVNQIATGARTRENVRVEFRNSPEFQARVNAIIAQGCLQ